MLSTAFFFKGPYEAALIVCFEQYILSFFSEIYTIRFLGYSLKQITSVNKYIIICGKVKYCITAQAI